MQKKKKKTSSITSPKNYNNKNLFATSTRGLSFWVVNLSTILERCQGVGEKSVAYVQCPVTLDPLRS